MAKSSIMIGLDDPRSDKIADAISNKTSKKILSLLAEKEMGPSEIASSLNLPLNTITYNLKKLDEAGLVEKSKKIFWSAKGKKIDLYRVSNKKIVIWPRPMIKGVIPTLLITGAIAFVVKLYTDAKYSAEKSLIKAGQFGALKAGDSSVGIASETAPVGEAVSTAQAALTNIPNSWTWFLLGGLTALLILLLWNYLKE